MTGWRGAHNLVATFVVATSVTGLALLGPPPRAFAPLVSRVHFWGGAPLLVLVVAQLWIGRRIIFGVRRQQTAGRRLNRVYAHLLIAETVGLVVSGVLIGFDALLNPVPRILWTQVHRGLTWLLVPTLLGHVVLSARARWQRARLARQRDRSAQPIEAAR